MTCSWGPRPPRRRPPPPANVAEVVSQEAPAAVVFCGNLFAPPCGRDWLDAETIRAALSAHGRLTSALGAFCAAGGELYVLPGWRDPEVTADPGVAAALEGIGAATAEQIDLVCQTAAGDRTVVVRPGRPQPGPATVIDAGSAAGRPWLAGIDHLEDADATARFVSLAHAVPALRPLRAGWPPSSPSSSPSWSAARSSSTPSTTSCAGPRGRDTPCTARTARRGIAPVVHARRDRGGRDRGRHRRGPRVAADLAQARRGGAARAVVRRPRRRALRRRRDTGRRPRRAGRGARPARRRRVGPRHGRLRCAPSSPTWAAGSSPARAPPPRWSASTAGASGSPRCSSTTARRQLDRDRVGRRPPRPAARWPTSTCRARRSSSASPPATTS